MAGNAGASTSCPSIPASKGPKLLAARRLSLHGGRRCTKEFEMTGREPGGKLAEIFAPCIATCAPVIHFRRASRSAISDGSHDWFLTHLSYGGRWRRISRCRIVRPRCFRIVLRLAARTPVRSIWPSATAQCTRLHTTSTCRCIATRRTGWTAIEWSSVCRL